MDWIIEVLLKDDKKSPAVFLDRDGVIIIEKHFQADSKSMEFLPGSVEGLQRLDSRYLRVVISNQSGISRGFYSHDDALNFNRALDTKLLELGVAVDAWYFCPHGPDDGCACRKPKPGLILKAAEELNIDLIDSWMIGDKSSDIGAGIAAGIKTILVRTGYAGSESGADNFKSDFIADNLYCAIDIINKGVRK